MIQFFIAAQLALAAAQSPSGATVPPASGQSAKEPAVKESGPALLNFREVITDADYPPEAIKAEQQGTVGILVEVSADGRARKCMVQSTSGSAILDRRTCELFMARARFTPVRDPGGKAISGTSEVKVNWALSGGPGEQPRYPRTAWSSDYSMVVSGDGTVHSCDVRNPVVAGAKCLPVPFSAKAAANLVRLAGGDLVELRTEEVFAPGDHAPAPPTPRDMSLVNRQIVRLTINPDGTAACEPLAPDADKPGIESACGQAAHIRFEPVSEDAPRLVGTLAMSAYLGRGELPARGAGSIHPPAPPPPAPPKARNAGQAADGGRSPRPGAPIIGLFTEDDYPPDARDANAEGVVGVLLDIGVNGRLTGCKIVMSSGSASLDAQTCRIIQQRARFSPARDAQGKPIAGKVFQRVTWRLEDTLMPSGAWVARTTLIADGPVDMPACSVVGEGAIANHASLRSKCKEVLEDLGPGATGTVPQGIVATVTADEQFIPEGTSDARVPPVKTGQILLGQEVLQLSIDASGKVAKCEVVSEAGLDLATGNPCANLGMRFEPVSGKEGKPAPFTAKLITRIFVDYQAKIKPAVVSEMRSRPQAGKGQS